MLVWRLAEPEKLLTWADGELAQLTAEPPRPDLERFILAWSHLLRGRSLVKLDEHEAAEEACRTALQLFQQLPAKVAEYRRGLARTWHILGLACLWRSRQLEAAAQAAAAAQKWQEALQAYEKALELDPGLASAHHNLGNGYLLRGQAYLEHGQQQDALQVLPWPSRLMKKP